MTLLETKELCENVLASSSARGVNGCSGVSFIDECPSCRFHVDNTRTKKRKKNFLKIVLAKK